ncbi:MAG TPA: transglutaminase domain-containing protein [Lentimicrobium sp.]|nr:transglutaminase domain-containing protein [Lentimicrobium sp.]
MKPFLVSLVTVLILTLGCTGRKHFISDSTYRSQVEKQFEQRKKLAGHRNHQLFGVFDKDLSVEQEEALRFLFAYMPLSDLADYTGEYYLSQVNLSFQARDEFSWGKDIPDDIFRHFVLPIRVNNENLDTARAVIYNELRDRLKGLNMEQAALEVNHWCHEKVNYRGSDGRTSSPLASMKTGFGRCGEESTFTVAAMRSVAIPARQVYTPRWAHTDDNHAWVEVFVDGKWQYLGACEPEAILNKGWFDVPVKRAMMVHTNVIGIYKGSENVIDQTELSTKINSLPSYTVTKALTVIVRDTVGKPVKDARVEFRIYNYAEFYPMVTKKTDENGSATLLTGLGDLQVWASKDDKYAYSRVSVGSADTVYLKLQKAEGTEYTEITENIPPVEKSVESPAVAKQEENNKRLAQEDSIRNAYMATFMDQEAAEKFALECKLDTARVKHIIALSYGNWPDVTAYLKKNASNPLVLDFIESLSQKDIRDTQEAYMTDHLVNVTEPGKLTGELPKDVFDEGLLTARVVNELIRPWRSFLKAQFNDEFKSKARSDISVITRWINDSITVSATENYMGCPLSPQGVYELRVADKHSRNIFFVALCRSLDIPARVDLATLLPQVYTEGNWQNITFENTNAPVKSAQLTLLNDSKNELKPEYSIHFTLQKFADGHFTTLDYEGSELVAEFPVKLDLEPGYYLLMTGHRRNDGSVSVRSEYFNLSKGDKLTKTVILQPLEQVKQVEGIIPMDQAITDLSGKKYKLSELAGDKGIVLAFINPGNEPTRHVMSDIPLLKADFEKWGGKFVFVISENAPAYKPGMYKDLPAGSLFAADDNKTLLNETAKLLGKSINPPLPFVMFVTEKGEVTFTSIGYRIGIGENLLKETRVLAL